MRPVLYEQAHLLKRQRKQHLPLLKGIIYHLVIEKRVHNLRGVFAER